MKNYECAVIKDGMSDDEIVRALETSLVYIDMRTPPIYNTPDHIYILKQKKIKQLGNVYVKAGY